MADFVVKLKSTSPASVKRMEAIVKNPEPILKQIGILLLADAQKAFRTESFDGEAWPARYPNQKPFYANVAGLVADFASGKNKPAARRFQNRPVGQDTGQTKKSLTVGQAVSIGGLSVVVSSNTKNAASLNSGGRSVQLITKSIKERLAAWMRPARKRVKRSRDGSRPISSNDFAASKLGWLFSKKSLVTNTVPRPFLGISKTVAEKIVQVTGGEFVAQSGGSK